MEKLIHQLVSSGWNDPPVLLLLSHKHTQSMLITDQVISQYHNCQSVSWTKCCRKLLLRQTNQHPMKVRQKFREYSLSEIITAARCSCRNIGQTHDSDVYSLSDAVYCQSKQHSISSQLQFIQQLRKHGRLPPLTSSLPCHFWYLAYFLCSVLHLVNFFYKM